MYTEIHLHIYTLRETCSLERFWFRISIREVQDTLWYHQPRAQEGSLLCLRTSFSSADLAVQVPCLPFSSSKWPGVVSCVMTSSWGGASPGCHSSVTFWSHLYFMLPLGHPSSSPIPLQHLLGAASHDSCCCHLSSREVISIIISVLCPPFHLAFHGEFLQERNSQHRGWQLIQISIMLVVGGCSVLARAKSIWKTGLGYRSQESWAKGPSRKDGTQSRARTFNERAWATGH